MDIEEYRRYMTAEMLMGPNSLRILEELFAKHPLALADDDSVLDLGCGKGLTSFAIAKETCANEEDMNRLPDLPSAFESVKVALNSDSVTPPHFNNQEKLRNTTNGIFGWYAKTKNGVIGIVRVTWCFYTEKYQYYYDDAYYIIEYGSDECKAIDRDALLELLGDYETTYIYTGEYNEYGKYSDIVYPMA